MSLRPFLLQLAKKPSNRHLSLCLAALLIMNAGGSSQFSEYISACILSAWCEAHTFIPEVNIPTKFMNVNIADYVLYSDRCNYLVSVTRLYHSQENPVRFIQKKVKGLLAAVKNTTIEHDLVPIMHVLVYNLDMFSVIEDEKFDTLVLVSFVKNNMVYEMPSLAHPSVKHLRKFWFYIDSLKVVKPNKEVNTTINEELRAFKEAMSMNYNREEIQEIYIEKLQKITTAGQSDIDDFIEECRIIHMRYIRGPGVQFRWNYHEFENYYREMIDNLRDGYAKYLRCLFAPAWRCAVDPTRPVSFSLL